MMKKLLFSMKFSCLTIVAVLITGCSPAQIPDIQVYPEKGGEVFSKEQDEAEGRWEVVAEPKEGYKFVQWTEIREDFREKVSDEATYQFEQGKHQKLLAEFDKKKLEINLDLKMEDEVQDQGEVRGGGVYEYGQEAKIEAKPETGYVFEKWTENEAEVSTDQEYALTVEEDRAFTAHFAFDKDVLEKETREEGDYKVTELVKGKNHLETMESQKISDLPLHRGSFTLGPDYFVIHDTQEGIITFWTREEMEQVDQVKVENIRRVKAYGDNYFALEKPQHLSIFQVDNTGVHEVKEFNLEEFKWDFEHAAVAEETKESAEIEGDWQDKWLESKFLALAGPKTVTIQSAQVKDYLFIYPDYSHIFHGFEEPPRLEDSFFKVYQFQDGGIELVESEIFDSSYLTNDLAPYPDDRVLVATGDEGFILLDLNDFSYEILESGGLYLDEKLRPFEGEYSYFSHDIRNVTEEGIVVASANVLLPKCNGMDVHLWVPVADRLQLSAISGYSGKLGFVDENDKPERLGPLPLWLENDYWMEQDRFQATQTYSKLSLDAEQAFENAKTRVESNVEQEDKEFPPLWNYLNMEVELENLFQKVGLIELPEVSLWKQQRFVLNRPQENEVPVFALVEDDKIKLCKIKADMEVVGADHSRRNVYVNMDDELHRIDFDSLF